MTIEIAHTERFPYELANVPKDIRDACLYWQKQIKKRNISPDVANPPKTKKIRNYKGLWRMMIKRDYRLVYHVDSNSQRVSMIMIDHRNKIYDRLDIDALDLEVAEGVSIVDMDDLLPEQTKDFESIRDVIIPPFLDNDLQTTLSISNKDLPLPLTADFLDNLGIAEQYHAKLSVLKTEEDLICADAIPDAIRERIMEYFWPSHIQAVIQKPLRIAKDTGELEEAVNGQRKIESFLLRLDRGQEQFVTRFKNDSRPIGPWLLKGGPGSGKSTVTLYCIKSLLDSLHQLNILDSDKPLKILYTTYTNSLVRVSEYLLKVLGTDKTPHKVEVKTVDSLATRHLSNELRYFKPASGDTLEYIYQAINQCLSQIKNFSFSTADVHFLLEEIDWVIIGQGLENVAEYLNIDRSGRGRALGRQQRKHLWALHEKFLTILHSNRKCLFSERLRDAAKNVTPNFDYIFIDEAQDLKPVSIRFLMGLCHNRKNIYLTADINQSIWGYSFSWTKMAEDLDVRGRVKILRRNYRTTKEVWEGVKQLAPTNDIDEETLTIEAVYKGQPPALVKYDTKKQLGARLNNYLFEALRQERTTPGSAAVLCPTHRETESVLELIDEQYKPKIMESREVDITWPGVKILTMHAAKGLEFPVVAVVGLEQGRLPLPVREGLDEQEHFAQQRRLFFVACSRAMRRLMVFAHKSRPSPFVSDLTDEYWNIEKL